MIKQASVEALKAWLDKDDAILIDVREPAEHSAAHIKQAHLISLNNICLNALPEIGNKKLVLHCKSGMRSTNACNKLLAENPELIIYNLEGGILNWENNGGLTSSSGKKIISLDRQVQLTIGVLFLISACLTSIISPLFIIVSFLIGIGLSIAGLTGHCGLALFIAKMPWNQKV